MARWNRGTTPVNAVVPKQESPGPAVTLDQISTTNAVEKCKAYEQVIARLCTGYTQAQAHLRSIGSMSSDPATRAELDTVYAEMGFQTSMLTKLFICFLLNRILVEKYLIRSIPGAVVFLIVTNGVLTLLWIFYGNPIAGSWNKMTPAKCFTDAQLLRNIIAQDIVSIIFNFALALLPIELLRNPSKTRETKIWLCILIIGIVAAFIPPLRPAYKIVTAGMKTCFSNQSFRESSPGALEESEHHNSKPASAFARLFRQGSNESIVEAAAHTVSVEAGRAQIYGEGEEGFAMWGLLGDQGVQKTIRSDIENMTAAQKIEAANEAMKREIHRRTGLVICVTGRQRM
ncbi:MAG: hypothetical protein Q9168_002853 [Polycauliona sp. 1 TL-2023]